MPSEDDFPTKPLSMPPVRAFTPDQLTRLGDITASFALLSKDRGVLGPARTAYGSVVSVLTAFISECQEPPPAEELRRELDGK